MINYLNLHKSIEYFENLGYDRIESPWTVSEYVDSITRPEGVIPFQLQHNNKCLVASGEQSFLYLYLKSFLPKGKFQTVTPCFRFESFDHLHTKYFMKNEIIITDDISKQALDTLVNQCLDFYQQFFTDNLKLEKTSEGYDITINGDELGSYGIRSCDFLRWIYGTACAEPRLSTLIKKYK